MSKFSKKKICTIGDVVGGGTPSTKSKSNYGGLVPWITPKDLSNHNGVYISKGERSITQEGLRDSSAKIIPANSILFSSRAPIGYVAISKNEVSTNQGFKSIIPNIAQVDTHYLYYLLKVTTEVIKRRSSGSTYAEISGEEVKNLELPFLNSVSSQKRVAKILFDLDSKIEINNKINDQLEQIAKTIYDYWFVQFDFPDANGKPYKSSGGKMVYNEELKREIPEKWEVKQLIKDMDVLYGFPFSTKQFNDIGDGVPVIRIRDILNQTISCYSSEDVDIKYRLSKNDLLVGMDGNFHINFWNKNNCYLNQRCFRVRSKKNSVSPIQAKFSIEPYIKAREKNVSRTTVGHLSAQDVKNLKILNELGGVQDISNKLFNDYLEQITSNNNQNEELKKLRDFLLPMLMNGQVSVKNK